MSIALSLRSRVPVVVAAIGASIACGGLMSASASVGSGDKSVYVPISPCRVMDMRPAPQTIGLRSTPLLAQETHTIAVLGSNGECTLPVDASAVAMNVTVVNPTSPSFLTVFPADVPRPLASSLNWETGQGATPNAVTSDVSSDGKVSFFNNAGSVDVIADIVGYFVDHHHDDRYHPRAEIDGILANLSVAIATKAPKLTGTSVLALNPGAFSPAATGVTYIRDVHIGRITTDGPGCFNAGVTLPHGATVTALLMDAYDNVAPNASIMMTSDRFGPAPGIQMAAAATSGTPIVVTLEDTTITDPVIDNNANSYGVTFCLDSALIFYNARIEYTNP